MRKTPFYLVSLLLLSQTLGCADLLKDFHPHLVFGPDNEDQKFGATLTWRQYSQDGKTFLEYRARNGNPFRAQLVFHYWTSCSDLHQDPTQSEDRVPEDGLIGYGWVDPHEGELSGAGKTTLIVDPGKTAEWTVFWKGGQHPNIGGTLESVQRWDYLVPGDRIVLRVPRPPNVPPSRGDSVAAVYVGPIHYDRRPGLRVQAVRKIPSLFGEIERADGEVYLLEKDPPGAWGFQGEARISHERYETGFLRASRYSYGERVTAQGLYELVAPPLLRTQKE